MLPAGVLIHARKRTVITESDLHGPSSWSCSSSKVGLTFVYRTKSHFRVLFCTEKTVPSHLYRTFFNFRVLFCSFPSFYTEQKPFFCFLFCTVWLSAANPYRTFLLFMASVLYRKVKRSRTFCIFYDLFGMASRTNSTGWRLLCRCCDSWLKNSSCYSSFFRLPKNVVSSAASPASEMVVVIVHNP